MVGHCTSFARKVNINLKERTDNGVKNHFYSKLRKAVRRINKMIS